MRAASEVELLCNRLCPQRGESKCQEEEEEEAEKEEMEAAVVFIDQC